MTDSSFQEVVSTNASDLDSKGAVTEFSTPEKQQSSQYADQFKNSTEETGNGPKDTQIHSETDMSTTLTSHLSESLARDMVKTSSQHYEVTNVKAMIMEEVKPGAESNVSDVRSSFTSTSLHGTIVSQSSDLALSSDNIADNSDLQSDATEAPTSTSSPIAIPATVARKTSKPDSLKSKQSVSSRTDFPLADDTVHTMDMIEAVHGYGMSTFTGGSLEDTTSFLARRVLHRAASSSEVVRSRRSLSLSAPPKQASSLPSSPSKEEVIPSSLSEQPVTSTSSTPTTLLREPNLSSLSDFDFDSSPDLTSPPGDRVVLTSKGVSFPMASSQRDFEFHTLFPNLDKTDMLVEDYACAWQKEILLQGRLYLTQRHVCFYAKIIWTYAITIPYEDIVSLEKKSVAGIFNNAIEVSTEKNKYFFATFMTRDNTYDYILHLWKGIPNHIKVLRQRDSALAFSNQAIEMTPLTPSPPRPASVFSERANTSSKGLAELAADFESNEDHVHEGFHFPQQHGSSGSVENGIPPRVIHQKVNVIPPTTLPPLTRSFAPDKGPNHSPLGKLNARAPLKEQIVLSCSCVTGDFKMDLIGDFEFHNLNVTTLFSLIYSQESFGQGFQKHYSDLKKFREMSISEWVEINQPLKELRPVHPLNTSASIPSLAKGTHRNYQYIQPLNSSFGPKETQCKVEDIIENNDTFFMCMTSVSQTPDVPSGNCFQTRVRVCLSTESPGTCRMKVYFQLEYTQSTWLKTVLDRAVKDGVVSHYQEFTKALQDYIRQNPPIQIEVDVNGAAIIAHQQGSGVPMAQEKMRPPSIKRDASQRSLRMSHTNSNLSYQQQGTTAPRPHISLMSVLLFLFLLSALFLNIREIRQLHTQISNLSTELSQQKQLLAKSLARQQAQQIQEIPENTIDDL